MTKYAIPVIGSTPIDKIGREDVLRILTPLWTKRPETARRLRQKMRAVFRWAQAHGFIENNPAGEGIDGALPKQPAVKAHFRALHYRDVAGALDTIEQSGASIAAKLAFRMLVLTAARSGEIRGAQWDEIDLDNPDVDHTGRAHEGNTGASYPVDGCGAGSVGTGRDRFGITPAMFSRPQPGQVSRCPI